MRTSFWTDERDAELRRMCAEGHTYRVIAEALGTTRNAALGRATRRGYRNGRMPDGGFDRRPRAVKPKPPEPPPEPPMPEPAAVVIDTPPVHITDLTTQTCRFPMWPHTEQPTMIFCGRRTEGESVYCPEHAKRCYTAAQARRA